MFSHCDRVPFELQCYIMDLKYRRERMDALTVRRKGLCQEMRLYHVVKDKWSIGRVACEPHFCSLCYAFHAKVYGHYRGQRIMLGYSLKQAISNVVVAKQVMLRKRINFVFVL